MTQRAVPAGTLVPGRSNPARLVKGWRPDEEQPLVLQLGVGQRANNLLSEKINILQKPRLELPLHPIRKQGYNTRLEQGAKQRMIHKLPMKVLSPKA